MVYTDLALVDSLAEAEWLLRSSLYCLLFGVDFEQRLARLHFLVGPHALSYTYFGSIPLLRSHHKAQYALAIRRSPQQVAGSDDYAC